MKIKHVQTELKKVSGADNKI